MAGLSLFSKGESMSDSKKKKGKGFKMPHLLYIMLGLIILMSLLTYVVPAGQYAQDADGKILGDQFAFLGKQTPVNPFAAFNLILEGMINGAFIVAILFVTSGNINVILETKSIDRLMDWALSRLQDKSVKVLVPTMYFLMIILGAFAGNDALMALIPVGVMFARKLRLDPIVAAGVTILAPLSGLATSPIMVFVPQLLMGVEQFSGFGFRILNMFVVGLVGCFFVSRYAIKISRDPLKSAMGNTEWLNITAEEKELERTNLSPRDIVVTCLFLGQFVAIVGLLSVFGPAILITIMIPVALICGIIGRFKADEIANSFGRGIANMAFVGLIVGLADTMSLVMTNGHILHTIVYYASLPLHNLEAGFAAIGISVVVMFINILIPSTTAKAAILIPIVRPMAETLNINGQVATQAFQIGDGFTNIISPFLPWVVGGVVIAGATFDRWIKWVIKIVAVLLMVEWILLYALSTIGWTGM
jgi:uncharacterized ion transporter superfamily protein YfcC